MQITVGRMVVLLAFAALVPTYVFGQAQRQAERRNAEDKTAARVSQGAQQVWHRGARNAMRKEQH